MKVILAASVFLCLSEAIAMADNSTNLEEQLVGATPNGWTATMTGRGNAKWTIEQDQTAPSKSKVIIQSGVATHRCEVQGRCGF
jgi:hypothetical protein